MGRDGRGIKAASESSIEITFMFRGDRCRERLALKPTPANLKRAENHRAAILHAIANNIFDYAATFPDSQKALLFARQKGDVQFLEAYLDDWLKGQKNQLKTSTYDGYRKIVENQLKPWFGDLRVADIRKKDIREKLDVRKAKNKTLANIQSVLRAALDDAVEDEIIETNPLAGWCYRKVEPPKEDDDIDPFTIEEQATILRHLEGQGRHLIQFALWTGLRTSELVALNWGDIDFIRGVAYVTKAMTQRAEAPESTKTRAGKREVKLLPLALAALEAQKSFTWLAGHEVFQNPNTNERWEGDQPIRKTLWTHALKRGGVRYRKPYQTRHTYASMMLSSGEHPMWVAKQMGHADWTMIAKVYGRWMPDADPNAGNKAAERFGGNVQAPALAKQPCVR